MSPELVIILLVRDIGRLYESLVIYESLWSGPRCISMFYVFSVRMLDITDAERTSLNLL